MVLEDFNDIIDKDYPEIDEDNLPYGYFGNEQLKEMKRLEGLKDFRDVIRRDWPEHYSGSDLLEERRRRVEELERRLDSSENPKNRKLSTFYRKLHKIHYLYLAYELIKSLLN